MPYPDDFQDLPSDQPPIPTDPPSMTPFRRLSLPNGRHFFDTTLMQHSPDNITFSLNSRGASITFHLSTAQFDALAEFFLRYSEDLYRETP